VSIPGCDLGLEKDESGYRSECQKKQGNQYEWKYTLPDWTLPHDLAEDELTAPPNYRTITAKATPPDASISFKLVGEEKDCIAFETANEGNGIYKIKVTSKKQSTPDSQGKRKKNGTVIEAWHKGKRVGSANFYVIVPKSLKRSKRIPGENNVIFDIPRLAAQKPGIVSFAEYEGQPVNWALEKGKTSHDEKSYFETQSVEILDQYGVSLGAMYEGSSVREDSNWIAWMKANGSYNDPVGVGGPDELMPNQYIPFVWEITVAGYNLGTLSRKLTIELDDGVKANYKLEYDD